MGSISLQELSHNSLISFTLQNDLPQNITLVVSKNKVMLQSGSKYRFEKPIGEKFYYINKDKTPQFLFEVDSSFENKNFKISRFLQ